MNIARSTLFPASQRLARLTCDSELALLQIFRPPLGAQQWLISNPRPLGSKSSASWAHTL